MFDDRLYQHLLDITGLANTPAYVLRRMRDLLWESVDDMQVEWIVTGLRSRHGAREFYNFETLVECYALLALLSFKPYDGEVAAVLNEAEKSEMRWVGRIARMVKNTAGSSSENHILIEPSAIPSIESKSVAAHSEVTTRLPVVVPKRHTCTSSNGVNFIASTVRDRASNGDNYA